MSLGELLDATLPVLPISEATRDRYRFALAHVPPDALKWMAGDITPPDARLIIDGLTSRVSASQVRKTHGALMACWREATNSGWAVNNPWRGQRLPRLAASAGDPLSDLEVAALLAACVEPIDRCWIGIHLATGARPGEVVGLRWSAIDVDDQVVTFVDAKHDGALRPVAIDAPTIATIRTWQTAQRQRALAAGCPLDADPWLLSNDEASATPWRREYAGGYRWRRIRTAAGLRPGLRLYDLRHTHNSWLSAANIDAATRAARIGNSPATNQRVYTHPMRDREAADVAGNRLGSVTGWAIALVGEGRTPAAVSARLVRHCDNRCHRSR